MMPGASSHQRCDNKNISRLCEVFPWDPLSEHPSSRKTDIHSHEREKELGHWSGIKVTKGKNSKTWCQQACREMDTGGWENSTDLLEGVVFSPVFPGGFSLSPTPSASSSSFITTELHRNRGRTGLLGWHMSDEGSAWGLHYVTESSQRVAISLTIPFHR